MAVDPTGKFAYVANFDSNNVSAYSIGANGALTPVPGSPFAAGSDPTQWRLTPRVSSPTWQTGGMHRQRLSLQHRSQRSPDARPGFALRGGELPRSCGGGSHGEVRLYVAKAWASNNVSAYSIGSNGALTPIPGSPFAAGSEPVSVAITRAISK